MTPRRKCPHCGYDNLSPAVTCFQCGNPLEGSPETPRQRLPRRSQRILRLMQQLDPGSPTGRPAREGDTEVLGRLSLEQPATCLNCGMLNLPTAVECANCRSPLLVPDAESRLRVRVSARSSIGRVRENNEDSVALWALNGVVIGLVADGMGGAVGGEEASRLVVEAVQAHFLGEARGSADLRTLDIRVVAERLRVAIQAANLAVIERVQLNPALKGMGTTATLVFVRGKQALIAHVGDSRAYLLDSQQQWIGQITSDHSFVEALVGAGHITEEQARHHPMKNVLYRALGQMPDIPVDLYERSLKAGDRIVICSDGVTRHVTSQDMARLVLVEDDPAAVTQRIIDLGNERGGEDNLTVIVLMIEQAPVSPTDTSDVAQDDSLPTSIPWMATTASDTEVTFVPTKPSDTERTLVEPQPAESAPLLNPDIDDEDTLITRRTAMRTITAEEIPALTMDEEESVTLPARPEDLLPKAEGDDTPADGA